MYLGEFLGVVAVVLLLVNGGVLAVVAKRNDVRGRSLRRLQRMGVDGDPHNHHLTASTVAALWPTFAEAGARRLILSCNLARGDNVDSAIHLYRRAIPNVRLT